jgi:acetyltransferase
MPEPDMDQFTAQTPSSLQGDRFVISRYPCALIDVWRPDTGSALTVRPVLPQDGPLVGNFFASLQPATRYRRFHATVGPLSAERLMQMTMVDYTRHLALVVTTREASTETVIADARYVVDGSDASGEFAIVVADRWHGKGIGKRVMQALIAAAAGQGLDGLWGDVHENNAPMLALMKRSGFRSSAGMAGQGFVRVERSMHASPDTVPSPHPSRAARLARLWARLRPATRVPGTALRQGGER